MICSKYLFKSHYRAAFYMNSFSVDVDKLMLNAVRINELANKMDKYLCEIHETTILWH